MNKTIVSSLLIAGLALGPISMAHAAKGGNSDKAVGGKQETPAATLARSMCFSTGLVGDVVYFWGEGYDENQGQALLQIGSGMWSAVAVADDGTVDFHWNYFQLPGDYTIHLYQNGKGKKLELKSEVVVTVQ